MNFHRSLVLLMLFSIPAAGAERRPVDESEDMAPRVRSLKADRSSRMQATAVAPKPVTVDCAKGESIQKQVDQCQSASDAWFDPTLTVEPGASVSNCQHGSLPAAP